MLSPNQARRRWLIMLPLVLVVLIGTSLAQVINGTISGDVKDATGAYVSKANVTVKALSIGVTRTTTTNKDGAFFVPSLPPGTYTVSVTAAGFKQLEKTGVTVSTGDRVSAGELVLEVGGAKETVTVEADAGQIQVQSDSGERSGLISGKQLNELAMNGRMVLDYIKILPGVISTFNGAQSNKGGLGSINVNGTRAGQMQLTIDGITNIDNGCNCATQVTINPDAIGEVKVLTSNFQAEYGKAAGAQMAITTKNGTDQFHGTARWFHRHEGLNAMNWFDNQANSMAQQQGKALPNPQQPYRYNYVGWQVGGPLLLPKTGLNKNKDKLYFFFSQEFYRQLLPGGFDKVYVPTVDEINGDFSKSLDGNRKPIIITDPLTGSPFPGNKIPTDRILPGMQQALLKIYPRANTTDVDPTTNRYNYITSKTTTFPRREDIGRLDYQINTNNRMFFRVVNNDGSQTLPEGLSPQGISNFQFPGGMMLNEPGYTVSTNLASTINNTTVNDLNFGWTVNHQNIYSTNNQVARSKYNIDIPLRFPVAADAPIPDFNFGGVPNQWGTWSYLGSIPWINAATAINFTDNITKTVGKHTLKTGIFLERYRKDQDAWGNYNGTFNFDGQSSQPLQTGNPYANALLGYYNSFGQTATRPRGFFRYTNLEFFVQDNFKVTHRLTLDFGMRFAWVQPQYDTLERAVFFDPAKYDPSKAVRLYYDKGNGTAWDPVTGAVVSSALKGFIVPGSGDPNNGIVTSKDGYPRGGFDDRGLMVEPRFGFAFDLFGNGKTVLRGGAGMTHDRFQGNPIYSQVTDNPLTTQNVNSNWGRVQDLPTLALANVSSPKNVVAWEQSGKVPTVYSYSLGIQHNLGFGTTIDVAYVGSQSRHLSQKYNLNAIPYTMLYTKAAQDPAQYGGTVPDTEGSWIPQQFKDAGFAFLGDRALQANFLRKYMGYGDISYMNWDGDANYNSLQISANKRVGRLNFGVAYTWSKTMTTSNSDGQWTNIIDPKVYNYTLASWDRPHVLAINYTYELPKFSKYMGNNKVLSYFTDGYQISGISQFLNGGPGTVGCDCWGYMEQNFLVGSWTENPTLIVKSNPTAPTSNPYGMLDPNAFAIAGPGVPKPWAQQYFRNGGTNNSDMSVYKNIPLGKSESRYLQLRVEAFNVFNHPQFWGINTGAQANYNGSNNGWDMIFNWDKVKPLQSWQIRPAGETGNVGKYFGEYNNGGNARIVQLGLKLYF